MKALIFHILFNFSISETTISDISLNTSNMSETTFAMNLEVNVSTTNSDFSTNMLAGNTANDITDDDEECGNNMNCRVVLTPIEDLSIPVDESKDTLGKTGTKLQEILTPITSQKKTRDNISKDTATIDPHVDVHFIKNHFKTNNVKRQAMSYSLLFLIIIN